MSNPPPPLELTLLAAERVKRRFLSSKRARRLAGGVLVLAGFYTVGVARRRYPDKPVGYSSLILLATAIVFTTSGLLVLNDRVEPKTS